MTRLRAALGGGPRLLVKRDDAIGFAFGGNKVRKMRLVAADARRQAGRHAHHLRRRAVESRARDRGGRGQAGPALRARRQRHAHRPPDRERLAGEAARRRHPVRRRRAMRARRRWKQRRQQSAPPAAAPYVIPLGASTPLGAAALAHAATELFEQIAPPDVIIHSSSSGGTQAGLVAGCALAGVRTRVIGISADEPAASLTADDPRIHRGLADLDRTRRRSAHSRARRRGQIDVDDRFVGDGYGVPTPESTRSDRAARANRGALPRSRPTRPRRWPD